MELMEIMKWTVDDYQMFEVFSALAKEADTAAKLINEKYSSAFGINQKSISVYHTKSCDEYYGEGTLTIDGIFEYRDNWWGGRVYKFECTKDSIFRMFRSCYLRKINRSELDPDDFDCNIEYIDSYFREFIEQLQNSK